MSIQAYQTSGSGTVAVPNPTIISPRAPSATDIVSPAGNPYQIGQYWENSVTGIVYIYIGHGNWEQIAQPTLGPIDTLTGNSGGAIGPTLSNVNLLGTANQITTTGAASTITFSLTGPYTPATYAAHSVLLGEGTSSIGTVGPNAATGLSLISQGAAADPIFGTVAVPGGGTGAVTLTGILTGNGTSAVTANAVTQHGVLIGGAANAASSLGVAATGTVLAGVTGADPAFTASPSVTGSITAGTTITATLGAITATNGNLVLGTAGNKILSTSVATTTTAGANSFGTVTLVGGTATVNTSAITTNSIVMLTRQTIGATGAAALGLVSRGAIVNGVSFVINALSTTDATALVATDVSNIGWMIIN